jgi:hypothetical protein
MSYLINPYQVKIIELNKDLEGLKLDKSCIIYDINEYKKYPVPTISLDLLEKDLKNINSLITETEYKIQTISKFINR